MGNQIELENSKPSVIPADDQDNEKWHRRDQSFIYDLQRICYRCFGHVGGLDPVRECRCDWRNKGDYKFYC